MLEIQSLRSTTNLIQNLWQWNPAICVLTKLLADSDVLWSLRATDATPYLKHCFLFPSPFASGASLLLSGGTKAASINLIPAAGERWARLLYFCFCLQNTRRLEVFSPCLVKEDQGHNLILAPVDRWRGSISHWCSKSCVDLYSEEYLYLWVYIMYNYDQFAPKLEWTPELHWKGTSGKGQKHVAPQANRFCHHKFCHRLPPVGHPMLSTLLSVQPDFLPNIQRGDYHVQIKHQIKQD